MITEELTCEERLKKCWVSKVVGKVSCCGITTLETKTLRGELIEVFKIFNSFHDIKHTDFFTRSFTSRGHEL